MTSHGLVIPTLNINGTSGKELLEQIKSAHVAVKEARRVHGLAIPHGRDYQTQPASAYRLAREQHQQRAAALDAVEADLLAIGMGIVDQLNSR